MTANSEPCEICGSGLGAWELAPGQTLDRCASCGHVQRDLARCPAGHRAGAWGGEAEMDRVRLGLTFRRVRAELHAPRGASSPARVFEAGFGSGTLLRRFLDSGADVAGADPGGLRTPVDPLVAAGGLLFDGPVDAVTEGLDSYDLVLGVHVVEHVADPWAFVRACARLARPGGRVVLVTPAGDSTGLSRSGWSWWMLEDPTHVRFFSAVSLALLVARSGLDVRAVTRPLADSLSVEAASLVRRRRGELTVGGAGVLADRPTRLAAAASLPVVLAARLLSPRLRPALQVVAARL